MLADNDHAAITAPDLAQQKRVLAVLGQYAHGLIGTLGLDDGDHADAAIERAMHLPLLNRTSASQPFEHRLPGPRTSLEYHLESGAQRARNVLAQAAAGDVRERAHRHDPHQC